MEKTFSIKEALSYGWNALKQDPVQWIFLVIGVSFLITAPSMVFDWVSDGRAPVLSGVLSLATGLASIVLQIGITWILLAHIDGKEWTWRDLYRHYSLFLNFLVASILFGLIVAGGLILLIVPGIIFAVMFGQYSYVIVDKGVGPIEALKQSKRITSGVRWKLLGFHIVSFFVVILGFIALLFGALIAIPVTTIAAVWVYRAIERQTNPALQTGS